MSDWFGCYKPYPKEAVVPESFTHPAKMGWDLCHKIFSRLETLGLERGSKILDPFAGIFTTGLVGGLRGYNVDGMELEPKFVDLAIRNCAKNANKFTNIVAIFQGDSRKDLLAVFGGEKFAAVVGSPAHNDTAIGFIRGGGNAVQKSLAKKGKTEWNKLMSVGYGKDVGQMANLPEGDFQAVISSPPYSEIAAGQGGLNTKQGKPGQQSGRNPGTPSQSADQKYGQEKGQLSNLPSGDFSAVVSSPPYEASIDHEPGNKKWIGKKAGNLAQVDYGKSKGQLGFESSETYWAACRDIYFNCFLLLKPGGFIALVVKDFVRKKKRVPLCDQTWQLLQAVGFEPVERNRAWLVEEREAATFFEANYSVKKERKSFFRRLAEKNGSPKIDFEEVLICRRPI